MIVLPVIFGMNTAMLLVVSYKNGVSFFFQTTTRMLSSTNNNNILSNSACYKPITLVKDSEKTYDYYQCRYIRFSRYINHQSPGARTQAPVSKMGQSQGRPASNWLEPVKLLNYTQFIRVRCINNALFL